MPTTNLGAVGFKPKGKYSSTVTYTRLDVVSYLGGSYLCIIKDGETVANQAPNIKNDTAYWQVLAIPGDVTDEYSRIYNEVVSMSNQVTTDKNTVNTLKTSVENTASQSLIDIGNKKIEVISAIEEYGAVQVTDTKPTNENVDLWIDDSKQEEFTLPEINDSEINPYDTWSSQKINEELQNTTASIYASVATDEEASEFLGI